MNLTKEQKELFDALHKARVTANEVFNQRAFRGIKPNVVDKYAETAHFVYELLQNADDANAEEVTIFLQKDKLLFKHNGTKHFDITAEDDDRVGDINSITGIGNSSKENTQNKIGKFGVGFKAVFQYSDTPEIYDDPFRFKIEDLIVPTLIDGDYPDREKGETLFVLPFRNPQKSFNDIKSRLDTLKNPILFLRNIKKIICYIETEKHQRITTEYSKTLLERQKFDDITLEKYHLQNAAREDYIFLFSRDITITLADKSEMILPIYVGFYYDEQNKSLLTKNTQNIYCFFPTKETFNACFISHAPFLLTENRQNIKRDEHLNKDLLRCIAYLASGAVCALRDYGEKNGLFLINENIVDIIPLYESRYYYDEEDIFEEPMKKAFKEMLEEEPILLSRYNKYLTADKAHITTGALLELLSQEQLCFLRGKEVDFLRWELISKLNKLNDENNIYGNIKDYSVEDFGNDITVDFMKAQKIDMVTKSYTFVRSDAPKYWKITPQTRTTAHLFRSAPIILTQDGEWVAPFTNTTTPNVFLPIVNNPGSNTDYKFISNEYLQDEMAVKFFNELEIKQPEESDYIRNTILKKYTVDDVDIEDDVIKDDFLYLLTVYNRVSNTDKEDEFIAMVKDSLLLSSTDDYLYKPTKLYLDLPLLKQYFDGNEDIVFFDFAYYKEHIGNAFRGQLINEFVLKLGVDSDPVIIAETLSPYEFPSFVQEAANTCKFPISFEDLKLHGFKEACTAKNITKEVSVYLWNSVLPRYKEKVYSSLTYKNHKRSQYTFPLRSTTSFLNELSTLEWIYDNEGNIHSASEIHTEDLATEYDLSNGLIELLKIVKASPDLQEKYGATNDEQRKYELGDKVEQEIDDDFSEEEALKAVRDAKAKKKAELARQQQPNTAQSTNDEFETISEEEKNSIQERLKKELTEEKARKQQQEVDKAKLDKLRATEQQEELPRHTQTDYSNKQLFDKPADNPTTSSPHKSDTSLALSDEEIAERQEQENNRRNLIAIAEDDSKRYTFEWFNALLELEFQASDEASTSSRGINLVFSKVEKDPNSDRGILLRNPSRYIPRALEEMENISVTFYLPDNLHITITFEVASVQDYVLRLKCKNEDVEQVSNLLQVAYKVYRAEIKTSSPIKLISELQTSFRALNFNDNDSLLDNLNPTIKFVFGPPGTGKTTHLVKNWINKVATRPRAKMLILCPTNKAADVIAKRALETINPKASPENWLYRFVATADDTLENHVCTRDSNIFEQPKCCVISTIARFSYDGFTGKKLKEIDWDYIIIDEASMIPLAEIVYPLYRCPSAQIVIAGDPFQIEPIVNEDRWKDENIYTMVNLNDFSNPKTVPVQFDILNLPVQYRAVPSIGRLFSEYAYNGGVSSNREQSSQRKLTIENYDVKSVNFVMFPVDYFSIFEPHKIGNSPIHIYSALFTFEFVKYVARNIEKQQDDKPWRIGIISPYRAQAEVINKLWEQRTELYPNVEVSIGTVHGFQGDECDIIIAVYNPPASGLKRAADRTFVNKKNILNVAISRAQDYLFILMPDRDFEHYDKLETKTIGFIAKKDAKEMTTVTSQKLEKIIFNDIHFIEKNTFVTTHQLANVYTAPASLYEVRFDDKSVDIQIQ